MFRGEWWWLRLLFVGAVNVVVLALLFLPGLHVHNALPEEHQGQLDNLTGHSLGGECLCILFGACIFVAGCRALDCLLARPNDELDLED